MIKNMKTYQVHPQCWVDGFDIRFAHKYDENRGEEFTDKGDQNTMLDSVMVIEIQDEQR
jgi:hypothetical protein